MIKFEKITIEGFRSVLGPLEFDLHRPGLNLLKGHNGSGKTSLFEALVWCLYGINLKGTTSDKVATWPEKRNSVFRGTSVTVEVAISDIKYKISRNKGYKGDIEGLQGNDKLFIFADKTLQGGDLHIKDMQVTIDNLLGVDSRTFVNSILFGQRMAKLIESDNSDKRKLFEELFDTYWVDGMNKRMLEAYREQELDINSVIKNNVVLDERITSLIHTVDHYKITSALWMEEHNSRLALALLDVSTHQKEALDTKTRYDELLSEYNAFDQEGYDKADLIFTEAEESLKKVTELWEDAQAAVAYNNDAIAHAQTGIISYQAYVDEEIKRLATAEEDKKAKVALRDKAIKEYRQEVQKATVAGPEGSDPCPTCGQEIKDEEAFKRLLDSMEEELEDLKERKTEAEQIQTSKDKLDLLEKQLAEQKTELTNLEALAPKLQVDLGEAKEAEAATSALFMPLGEMISAWDDKNKAHTEVKSQLGLYKALLDQRNTALGQSIKRLTTIQEEIQPDYAAKLKIADEELARNKEILDENLVSLGKMEDKLARLDWWNKKVLSSSGLRAYVFKAMLGQLNEFTRKYGQRLGVSLEFSIDLTKASKPFKTVCSLGEVKDKEYNEFSGGEKQRLDIVLVFAMHDLISQQADMNVLIMDEVFEGLDEEGESSVFDLIRMKAEEGKAVYVISHSQVLDTLYSNTITVSRNSAGSTIIQ